MTAGQIALRQHLKALGWALCICGLIMGGTFLLTHKIENRLATSARPPQWARNYDVRDISTYLRLTLKSKRDILMFGSCELANDEISPALIPYHFVPENWGVPVLAIGHGGLQSLAIAAQLAAYFDDLKDARIVIILSIDWFSALETRTRLPVFLEFMPSPLLSSYYFQASLPDKARKRIDRFLFDHKGNIKSSSRTLTAIFGRSEEKTSIGRLHSIIPYANAYFFEYLPWQFSRPRDIARIALDHDSLPDFATAVKTIDWLQLEREADQRYTELSTNNPFGILNEWYDRTFKQQGPWPQPMKEALIQGEEFKDFQAIVEILKEAQCRPFFVIQGLNPKAYNNLETFEPLVTDIQNTLIQNRMDFVDLWHEPYHPSSFWGPIQIGDYGWLKINRAIYDYFIKEKA